MVPILSGIIAGGGRRVTTARAFALSLTYVLGMALTYTVAGVACAAAGRQVQAIFQQWWVLALFAALFVAMALSMFGLFTVQMPAAVQTRIAGLSNRQSAGTFGGVAVMGALSALIVTTCVGPALVGALVVISQTGQMVRGGAALFAMSIGMGTPLLVVGASAGRLLPKAGPWMDFVKKVFGVMMLAVAAWMLARIVPEQVALALWAIPALILAALLWSQSRRLCRRGVEPARHRRGGGRVWSRAGRGLGARRHRSARPHSAARHGSPDAAVPHHQVPRGPRPRGGAGPRPCTSGCWWISRQPGAPRAGRWSDTPSATRRCRPRSRRSVLLRADVTQNDADDQALLKHFGIFGPPTIAFYGTDGRSALRARVVGYMKADAFAARARAALRAPT